MDGMEYICACIEEEEETENLVMFILELRGDAR